MTSAVSEFPRLTELSHGGGCGCKISPGVLAELLKGLPQAQAFPNLLVGAETADDAAVYRLNDEQAIVATTDFFMPIVDDPYDFGRIAAANALSDVYAMGGTPILALALVGMPINVLPRDTIASVLRGGDSLCAEAGIPIAGGHSIDSVEPIYGLAALGVVHPDHLTRNRDARAGDVLILSKALGVGILSAALKKNRLDDDAYQTMIASTTQLNRSGPALARLPGVHAMTDVTGFGLLGHTLELCTGAKLRARLRYAALPWLGPARDYVEAGVSTGASTRNWASYGNQVTLGADLTDTARTLLTDPQTSGGLLISCAADAAGPVLARLKADGFHHAAVIGEMTDGAPGVSVD